LLTIKKSIFKNLLRGLRVTVKSNATQQAMCFAKLSDKNGLH